MKRKVSKKLNKAAHRLAPSRENRIMEKVMAVLSIKPGLYVDTTTRRYSPRSPRAVYQKLKK